MEQEKRHHSEKYHREEKKPGKMPVNTWITGMEMRYGGNLNCSLGSQQKRMKDPDGEPTAAPEDRTGIPTSTFLSLLTDARPSI